MNREEIEEKIRRLKTEIEIAELYLDTDSFQDFCDSTETLICWWNSIIKNNLN